MAEKDEKLAKQLAELFLNPGFKSLSQQYAGAFEEISLVGAVISIFPKKLLKHPNKFNFLPAKQVYPFQRTEFGSQFCVIFANFPSAIQPQKGDFNVEYPQIFNNSSAFSWIFFVIRNV